MTVTELLKQIIAVYPGASPEAMRAYKPVFQARLAAREGPALAKAATEVFATFRPKYGQQFPIPADFEAALPALPSRRAPMAGRPIDAHRHAERVAELVADWRRRARRVPPLQPELQRALEAIARGLAHDAAWRSDAKPIELTAAQVRLAEQRALSQRRRAEHGPPEPLGREAWWAQISAIAARWQVAVSPQEWGL
jgi:hypothetical protein